jgi:hypothetical protein
MNFRQFSRTRKLGTSMVELAFMLPILTTVVLGSMELSRGVMVKHVLEEAARAGCRVAIMEGASIQDVHNAVNFAMNRAKLAGFTVRVNPTSLDSLGAFEPVSVTIQMPFANVSWVKANYMDRITLTGTCVMPKEVEADEEVEIPDSNGKKNKKNKKTKTKRGKRGKKAKK